MHFSSLTPASLHKLPCLYKGHLTLHSLNPSHKLVSVLQMQWTTLGTEILITTLEYSLNIHYVSQNILELDKIHNLPRCKI